MTDRPLLATNRRHWATRRVLSEPQFRARAASFAEEFARHDTEAEIVRRILATCHRNAVARQTSHA
jgi:UDP:flavonoid glycosyltransferase YjiC (YdhE family)